MMIRNPKLLFIKYSQTVLPASVGGDLHLEGRHGHPEGVHRVERTLGLACHNNIDNDDGDDDNDNDNDDNDDDPRLHTGSPARGKRGRCRSCPRHTRQPCPD